MVGWWNDSWWCICFGSSVAHIKRNHEDFI